MNTSGIAPWNKPYQQLGIYSASRVVVALTIVGCEIHKQGRCLNHVGQCKSYTSICSSDGNVKLWLRKIDEMMVKIWEKRWKAREMKRCRALEHDIRVGPSCFVFFLRQGPSCFVLLGNVCTSLLSASICIICMSVNFKPVGEVITSYENHLRKL